jgi:choline dehydrogenase-like flavoprotein
LHPRQVGRLRIEKWSASNRKFPAGSISELSGSSWGRPHLASRRVTLLTGKTVVRIFVENKRAVGVELMDQGLETIKAGEVVLLASTVHSPTILMHSGIGLAEQLRQRGIAVIVGARLKSGSIADSCRGAYMSGGDAAMIRTLWQLLMGALDELFQ